VGGISWTNDVPNVEFVLSFFKNDYVQQPVIFSNMNENQNPWHMHIFNIHSNIQQNKRLLTKKLWEELAGQITYPIFNIYYQIKGQNSSKRVSKFQLDM
jgi:hypothetical protein